MGGVVNNQIKRGLLPSLPVKNFNIGELLAKLQARTWLSRAHTSYFSSVVARRTKSSGLIKSTQLHHAVTAVTSGRQRHDLLRTDWLQTLQRTIKCIPMRLSIHIRVQFANSSPVQFSCYGQASLRVAMSVQPCQ